MKAEQRRIKEGDRKKVRGSGGRGIATDRRRMNPIDDGQDSEQSFPKESSFRSYRKLASKAPLTSGRRNIPIGIYSHHVSATLPRLLKPPYDHVKSLVYLTRILHPLIFFLYLL